MRKTTIERAKVLKNAVVAHTVISSHKAVPPKDTQVASFGCNHCNAVFASSSEFEPFCVNCGSEDTQQLQDDNVMPEVLPQTDDGELSAVLCRNCGSHNIVTESTVRVMAGHMHCVECGTSLTYDVAGCSENAEDEGGGSFWEDAEEAEVLENTTDEQVGSMDESQGTISLDDDDIQQAQDEVEGQDQIVEAPVDSLIPKEQDYSVASVGSSLKVFKGNHQVASLEKEDAGDNEQVFDTPAFQNAVAQTLVKQGFKATVANFGMKLSKVSIPKTAIAKAVIAKEVAQQKQDMEQFTNDTVEDLAQCLSIASEGLNKGIFKGKSNPLKRALSNVLSQAGVTGSAKLVDSVFASAGTEFNKVLLSTALELKAKPLDARNAIANTLNELADQLHENEDEDTNYVANRLEHSAFKVAKPITANVNTESTSVVASVAASRAAGVKLF